MSPWRRLLRSFDMLDAKERPQFSKLAIVYIAGVATTQGTLGTTLAIAIIAAAFGRSVFTAFLYRGQFTSSDSLEVNKVEEQIRQRRSPEGFEETP